MSSWPSGRAHRLDGGLVGEVLLALAHPAAGGQRGGLGDLEHLDDPRGAHTLLLVASRPPGRRPAREPTTARESRYACSRTATKCPSGPPTAGSDWKYPSGVTNACHSGGTRRRDAPNAERRSPLPGEEARDDVVVLLAERACTSSTPQRRPGRTSARGLRQQPRLQAGELGDAGSGVTRQRFSG